MLIKEFLKQSKTYEKSGFAKVIIRELDEERPGHFVSYVDEGEKSYDVHIIINNKTNIEKYACDCGQAMPCVHIYSIVKKNFKSTAITKSAKPGKTDPAAQLLQQIDTEALKMWLQGQFKNNPELHLSFSNHFQLPGILTAEKITAQTKLAVKIVAKTKKNIDATMLKKILQLWKEAQQPAIDYFIANPADDNAFEALNAIEEQAIYYHQYLNINSTKFYTHATEAIGKTTLAVHDMKNENEFKLLMNKYARKVLDKERYLHLVFLEEMVKQFTNGSSERKAIITAELIKILQGDKIKNNYDSPTIHKTVFELIQNEASLISKCYSEFSVFYGKNEYNLILINAILLQGDFPLAARHCEDCIAQNYSPEFDTAYLIFLKKIYSELQEPENLNIVREKLFRSTFDYDDYVAVLQSLSEQEKLKYRTLCISLAKKSGSTALKERKTFLFRLYASENNVVKLSGLIRKYSTYELINEYFEQLMPRGIMYFMNEILNKEEDYSFMYGYQPGVKHGVDEMNFLALCKKINKYIREVDLHLIVNEAKHVNSYYTPTFVKYYYKFVLKNE